MTVTELKELRQRRIELRDNLETLEELESKAERVTRELKKTPQAETMDSTLEHIVLEIVELRKKLEAETLCWQTMMLEAEYEIARRVQSCAAREVLKLRYVEGESWTSIETKQNSSRSRLMRLNREGLQAFGLQSTNS